MKLTLSALWAIHHKPGERLDRETFVCDARRYQKGQALPQGAHVKTWRSVSFSPRKSLRRAPKFSFDTLHNNGGL